MRGILRPEGHTRLGRSGQRSCGEGGRLALRREGHAGHQEGVSRGEGRVGQGPQDRGVRLPLWNQHRVRCRRAHGDEVRLRSPGCRIRGGKSVHLLSRHAEEDQGDDRRARPEQGGRRELHAQDARTAVPEHRQRGGAQQVSLRDGEHTGPMLVGPQIGAGGCHREGERPRAYGRREGVHARTAPSAEDTRNPGRTGDRWRTERHDRRTGDS